MHGMGVILPLILSVSLGALAQAATAYSGQGVTLQSTTSGQPQEIPATLLKPEGNGPFPAIVVLHDCSGLGPRSSGDPGRWGNLLAAEGYVIIIPDSFSPRGYPQGVCIGQGPDPGLRKVSPNARVVDAYAALAYLRGLPYVDGKHVAVMGGSHGGSSTLATIVTPEDAPLVEQRRGGFAAAIALYPGCGSTYGAWSVKRQGGNHGPVVEYMGAFKPMAPLLILIGEKDDWTPAADCEALVEHASPARPAIEIKVYPGVYHSFDSDKPPRYLDNRRNVSKLDGHGATTGGDPAAWADSILRVKAFFASYLKSAP